MTEEEKEKLWNSYFYEGTTVLKNKLDIRDKELLQEKEKELSFIRLVELYENPIPGNFDCEHLKQIHKYIFGDLYDWAGEYRYVDMAKTNMFSNHEKIPELLTKELAEGVKSLENVNDQYMLACYLTTLYVELMDIHPFREGNGRSCRELIRQLVKEKTKESKIGPYEINWENFDGEAVLKDIPYGRVFRGRIEMEFYRSLVPADQPMRK